MDTLSFGQLQYPVRGELIPLHIGLLHAASSQVLSFNQYISPPSCSASPCFQPDIAVPVPYPTNVPSSIRSPRFLSALLSISTFIRSLPRALASSTSCFLTCCHDTLCIRGWLRSPVAEAVAYPLRGPLRQHATFVLHRSCHFPLVGWNLFPPTDKRRVGGIVVVRCRLILRWSCLKLRKRPGPGDLILSRVVWASILSIWWRKMLSVTLVRPEWICVGTRELLIHTLKPRRKACSLYGLAKSRNGGSTIHSFRIVPYRLTRRCLARMVVSRCNDSQRQRRKRIGRWSCW